MLQKSVIFITLAILLCFSQVRATEDSSKTGWIRSLMTNITTTQTAYSDSWQGGEAGSFNWVADMNGSASRDIGSWLNLKTTLKLSYGQTVTQEIIDQEGTRHWTRPKKSTDLIDFEVVGKFPAGAAVDPYLALRIETQFFDGRNVNKKLWLSPLTITESAGLTRIIYDRKENNITSRLGLALRQILKTEIIDSTLSTVDSTLTNGGIESVTDVILSVHKNIRYTTKLTMFKALFFSGSDNVQAEFANNWKAVDVNWENRIDASVTKIVTVNLYMQLLYDKEVSRSGRFKQTMGLGFVFKLL